MHEINVGLEKARKKEVHNRAGPTTSTTVHYFYLATTPCGRHLKTSVHRTLNPIFYVTHVIVHIVFIVTVPMQHSYKLLVSTHTMTLRF